MQRIYIGLDVALEMTSLCAVDEHGVIVSEDKVLSDPMSIGNAILALDREVQRVALEAGPLSQWLYFGLKEAGLPVVCIETRHAKAVIGAMSNNKNDRNDARSIAQIIRSGWFKAVHVKSTESQELRTLLIAREFFVNKLRDHENEIRGLLRPFGLKVGRVRPNQFEARVLELTEGSPRLRLYMEALLRSRRAVWEELANLHRELLRVTRNDQLCRRFMTIPGVGPVTALAFKTTIDRPDRFAKSSTVGAHLGLTPRQHQSGDVDRRGRISRSGDAFTRHALFNAAHVMLTRSQQWTTLKAWGMRIVKRSNLKKAKIAIARKLAVVMHRMWKDNAPFEWTAKA